MTVPEELMLDLRKAGALTPRALHLPAGTTTRQVIGIVQMLKEQRETNTFALGDALVFADNDDAFSEVVEGTGLNFHTWQNRMSICRRVRPEVRREELTFEHHDVVRKLEPSEQVRYLSLAVENGWTRQRLRDEVYGEKVLPPAVSNDLPDVVRDAIQGAKEMMDGWLISRDSYQRLKAALGEEQ